MALRCLLVVVVVLAGFPALAAQVVRVGAAHFPPYTVRPELGDATGLLPQMLDALNKLQSDYQFTLVPTSLPRRFGDFKEGRIDMAIFENPAWGWQDIPHQNVDLGLEDAEIMVAHTRPGMDQGFFDDLKGKRLALFSGYHYAFAHFNADPKYLADTYNATLTYSHDSNLLMVERGRADIALVTRSYLKDYIKRNPGSGDALLASVKVDQTYHHYALLRPEAPITPEKFSALIEQLRHNGELERIFSPYQIAVMSGVAGNSGTASGTR